MASKGNIKEVFPGGNTYKGFHSFYDYILPQEEANRIFCIKGGPGVGKSSFMKAVAKEFVDLGYDVELHHCSSDNNSLDGVVIKQAKVALLDGTAPHVVDPKNPGAVDEILNFGDFWNVEGFTVERDTILNFNKEVKFLFNSSYHYLNSAKEMQDDIEIAVEETVDKTKFSKLLLGLKAELTYNLQAVDKAGKERHLFDSAITPDGLMDYIDTLIKDSYKCYFFEGLHTKGISEILNVIAKEYLLNGYNVEIYHQPLNPERIETVLVEELGLAFTDNSKMKNKAYRIVDLDKVLIPEKLESKMDTINKDKEMKSMLLEEAYKRVYMAKKNHDDMEKSYVPQMNFAAVTECKKQIIERIKKYL
ncbi:MAG: ATPase [Clostridia bacterium]|nr:ATPase [Clostridia bacterium]